MFQFIQEYGGADYFDSDRNSPYKYASVLFCCQRFGDAINHLWQANKSFVAAHLAVLCLHYGLILPHVALTQNPPHPLVSGAYPMGDVIDPTPAQLLSIFLRNDALQANYPEICIDYLISLDCNWLMHAQGLENEMKEVQKLKAQATISSTLETFLLDIAAYGSASGNKDELNKVAGRPIDDAATGGAGNRLHTSGISRSPGRIDDYLDSGQVNLLLSRCAFYLLSKKDAELAIHFFLLSGRYPEVVEELCNELCTYFVPAVGEEDKNYVHARQRQRQHWRSIAESFIKQYLSGSSGSPSSIYRMLVQNGQQELIDSLLTLLGLYQFIDLALLPAGITDISQSASAISAIDQLNVLPTAEEHVKVFGAVKPLLRRVFDDVLLTTMDCIRKEYLALKSTRYSQPTSMPGLASSSAFAGLHTSRDSQIIALKERSRAILQYASKVKSLLNRTETLGTLARLDALLV